MNLTKRIGMMAQISKGFTDRGLKAPTFRLPNGKRLSSSRFRQIIRLMNENLAKFDAEQAAEQAEA